MRNQSLSVANFSSEVSLLLFLERRFLIAVVFGRMQGIFLVQEGTTGLLVATLY
jgi:hypothetical protein